MVIFSGVDTAGHRPGTGTDDGPPRVAWAGVGVIAALAVAVLVPTAMRYGFFGDELYYRASGDRLAPAFADNGPAVPAIAHVMSAIAPDSLLVLRLPSIVLAAAGIVVTALIARELGGGRGAQMLAAAGYATGLFLLGQAVTLSSNVVDIALWTVVTWLVVRWTRTRSDHLLLLAALVTAAAFQVKWLIPFFWICATVAVLAVGPREMLRRPLLWVGAAVVVVTAVPSLLWQAAHGWPQLAMSAVVAGEQEAIGGRVAFVPLFVAAAGPLGAILLVYGTWRLLRSDELRPYRFLGLTVLLVVAAFVITDGRVYYPLGTVPVAIAAGAVELVRRAPRWLRRWGLPPVVVLSAAIAVSVLPWQPAADVRPAADSSDLGSNLAVYGKFGWPELATTTSAAYRALPPDVRARTVVLTPSYWSASAIDQLGDGVPVYGTGRGFWYFGRPADTVTSVLWVGPQPPEGFTSVRRVATVDEPRGMPGDTRGVGVWFADGPRQSWADYWAAHDELG
jgi:hypothetical protein